MKKKQNKILFSVYNQVVASVSALCKQLVSKLYVFGPLRWVYAAYYYILWILESCPECFMIFL